MVSRCRGPIVDQWGHLTQSQPVADSREGALTILNPAIATPLRETPSTQNQLTGQLTFRVDAAAQARSLLDFDRAPISLGLYPLVRDHHRHIVLTGTGATHAAALPSWRRLVAGGKAASWIDIDNLLQNPHLVTSDSLLIAASRSGAGSQVCALTHRLGDTMRPAATVAITDDLTSPLAQVADCEILLRSGPSSSPKGFLNALIAHDYVASMILNEDNDDVCHLARTVATTALPKKLQRVVAKIRGHRESRLAYVGFGNHAAAALYAALLTNELTTIPADGHIAGQDQDELLQKAEPHLTVLLLGSPRGTGRDLHALARDLIAAGSNVMVIGATDVSGPSHIPTLTDSLGAEVARNAVVIEHFVSALAA
jgi:fructoselysine-6-P-deglycase FrlB-like protein